MKIVEENPGKGQAIQWILSCVVLLLALTAKGQEFGTQKEILFALKGQIYLLEQGTPRLPDFSQLKPVGVIHATKLNITPRSFESGFPGVTSRFEWFAIDYHGQFVIEKAGNYLFRLTSDDGAKLFIDDRLVIDNDGLHPHSSKEAAVQLSQGIHKIRVPYFQGPRFEIALVLEVARQGEAYGIFSTEEMGAAQVSEVGGQTRINLASVLLFDFNRHELKEGAETIIKEIKESVIDKRPTARVLVEGHTDDIGSEQHNLQLSILRAQSVTDRLIRLGVVPSRMEVKGHGESKPKLPNNGEENRAKNRRVEISVMEQP